jgi:FOG: TPR repeat, SEL1 subfamily
MKLAKWRMKSMSAHAFVRLGFTCSLCFILVFCFALTGCAPKNDATREETAKKLALEKEPARKEAVKQVINSALICNNARLSDDDAIRQIASFFAACMTKSFVTADSISFSDCETILRMMLVHTDAIIDTRVKMKDSVVSVDLKVANEYISQLFNCEMPAPDSSAQSSQTISKSTIVQLKNAVLYFGEEGWSIDQLNYSDTVSDDINYGDDGVVKGTFVFYLNADYQATVELTLVPSRDAFRYYVVSYQVTRENRQQESTATAKPSTTAKPSVSQVPDARLTAAIDAYDSGRYKGSISVIKEYAENGNAIAQRYLADAYQYSRGVTGSAKLTFYWYSMAAEQGEADAECFLGSCYRNGTGTKIDLTKMLYWYEKSVDQENKYGLINLGYCYHKGIGVTVDLDKARDLYERADAAGHPYAKKRLAELNALCGK